MTALMERLNYSTHAISDIDYFRSSATKTADRRWLKHIAWIRDALTVAVKFQLPDNGHLLFDIYDMNEALIDSIHLPFPIVALEYATDLGEIDKVITIAIDIDLLPDLLRSVGPMSQPGLLDGGGAYVTSITHDPRNRTWSVSPFNGIMPYRQSLYMPKDAACKVGVGPLVPQMDAKDLLIERLGGDAAYDKRCVNEMYVDLNALANLCLCNLCSNVDSITMPPPKFINQQRIKKGKPPFFEYRMLTLKASDPSREPTAGVGTHASPRLHLRRGHIRRLSDSRLVWVRHTIVGDKSRGFLDKDYRFTEPERALAESAQVSEVSVGDDGLEPPTSSV